MQDSALAADSTLAADSGALPDSATAIDSSVFDAAIPDSAIPDAFKLLACIANGAYVISPAGRRYRTVTAAADWLSAEAACVVDEAHLAVINNGTENTYVRGLISGDFWIGFHDMNTEDSFEWVTGAPVTFTKWSSEQPNNSGNQDCVEITNTAGEWNDAPCDELMPYVCECGPDIAVIDE